MGLYVLLDLADWFLSQIRKVFSYYLLTGGWRWTLTPWWTRLCLGACQDRTVGPLVFRKPVSWWVWLLSPQLAVWLEASQHWSLQVVGWGQVLVQMSQYGSHQECSRGWMFPIMSVSSVCVPRVSHSQPPFAPPGDLSKPAGRCSPGSYQITAFALGPSAHEILCVLLKSEACISPSFLGLVFLMPDPWAEEPYMGLRTLSCRRTSAI